MALPTIVSNLSTAQYRQFVLQTLDIISGGTGGDAGLSNLSTAKFRQYVLMLLADIANNGGGGGGSPTGAAGGDLGDFYPDPSVTALQGSPVSAVAPVTNGMVLAWIDGEWTPYELSPPPPPSGDATSIQGVVVSSQPPSNTQVLAYNSDTNQYEPYTPQIPDPASNAGKQWSGSVNYAAGDIVSTSTSGVCWVSLSSGNQGNDPETPSSTYWVRVQQTGGTEWFSGRTYSEGDIATIGGSDTAYVSQQFYNTGNNPSDYNPATPGSGEYWQYLHADAVTIKDRAVSSSAPSDGQVLTWVAGSSNWAPITPRIVGGVAWASGEYYNQGDIVSVSGTAYVSLENGNVGNDPVNLAGHWAVLVASPVDNASLGGIPTAPTASVGTDTTQIATTAFTIANRGDRYLTTSVTSNAITNGTKTFTVQSGLSYIPTQDITVVYNNANHMHGTVTSYNSVTGVVVIDVSQHTGSGTYTAWTINVGGLTSINGALLSANNLNDVANASTSLTNLGGVATSRQVLSGTGLTGGGDLTIDRTLSVVFGTTSTTSCVGNDSRLSNSRTPTGTAGGALTGSYPNPGLATVAIGSGGTGATTAVTARTALGLAIGTDVQAYSASTTLLGNTTTGSGSIVLSDAPSFTGTVYTPGLNCGGSINSDVVIAGILGLGIRTVTAGDYSSNGTNTVLADASGGAVTYTLPLANTLVAVIKKIDSSANTVTVLPTSGAIDGASSKVLFSQYQSVTIICDGSNYFII
jgi:hypothetical protein